MANWWDFFPNPLGQAGRALANIPAVKSAASSAGKAAGKALLGTPARTERVRAFEPFQEATFPQFLNAGMQGLQQLGQMGQNQFRVPTGGIQNLFNQTLQGSQGPNLDFQPIENYARRQFQTQTIPGIAERFTALGGGQRSSAFQGALGGAASDLESQLGALRSQYGLQAGGLQSKNQYLRQQLLGQLMGSQAQQFGQQGNLFQNLSSLGLTSPFNIMGIPGQQGLLHTLLPLAASAAGSYFGMPGMGAGRAFPF